MKFLTFRSTSFEEVICTNAESNKITNVEKLEVEKILDTPPLLNHIKDSIQKSDKPDL